MVTTTYTARGLPLATAGDVPYVTASAYNAQGQANRFDLGSGPIMHQLLGFNSLPRRTRCGFARCDFERRR